MPDSALSEEDCRCSFIFGEYEEGFPRSCATSLYLVDDEVLGCSVKGRACWCSGLSEEDCYACIEWRIRDVRS